MPEFDREGGSRRVFHFLEFFQRAGWTVSFAADNAEGGERYVQMLQQMGIPVYAFHRSFKSGTNEGDGLTNPGELIKSGRFDLILFAFWICAEPYIPLVRGLSPSTKVVVDSIDLHFLRESRRVFCSPQSNGHIPALNANYAQEMRRELNVYAAADAVVTVSEKEAGLINDLTGKLIAHAIPDREDLSPSPIPFAERKGMLFVGNFRHPPNVQAVEYLCRDILPKLPAAVLAEHPVYVVGNDPSETVVNCCNEWEAVRLVGWVPSVVPYLERVRLSVIPLLYGAGTKRKLMQSLMAGTPAVSTSIGIEGLDLQHDRHVLVADSAAAFASSITRLITDRDLWQRVAEEGREFVRTRHGGEIVFRRFSRILAEIMDPLSTQPIFFEEMQPGSSSGFDYERDNTVKQQALQKGKVKGVCNVSGRSTEFVVSSDNLRESLVSTVSSSINRHRQLICTLSTAIFGHPRASLAAIAAHINQNRWKVYIAEANSVLSDFLKRNLKRDLFVCSEYFGPTYQSGQIVNGILHEDLQHTSFEDEAFNIIITSEVLEHVPDAPAAEKELMRILKPGGIYCFTVPFLPIGEHDQILADIDEQGKLRHFAEPQYHGDPIRPSEGILVYRLFSFNDLKERFESMEHEFKSYRFWSESLGILGSDCWAHTVKKRTGRIISSG
jgi:SAM-dependent methyltransferase/glycosyltransferase involved in cell wall biosynthesis